MGILSQVLEKRSVSVVPTDLWRSSMGRISTAAGVNVTPTKALQYSAVFGCVRILAETVAQLPLPVYERLPNGGKRKATQHHLYSLLHDLPNPEMTSFELRETLMGHLGTWGNAYAEIEYDRAGRPLGLWPLRPDRTTPERVNGNLIYNTTLPTGETVPLANERVMHIRGLGFDGLLGYSPIGLARQAIGLGLAAEEFGARFFSNDARPGGVLEHPGTLGEDAFKRVKQSWDDAHRGLERSHRVAILEEGLTFKEVGIPPEDAQYLETRKFQVTDVARFYRVPPHMLADLDRATFSNIEQLSLEFVIYTLTPWLVRWEQGIHRDLMTPAERQRYLAEFLVNGLLRGDIESRYQAYSIGRQNGFLSANDIRRMENMNPIEDGDVYLVPLNMIPASSLGAEPPAAPRNVRHLQATKAERSRRSGTQRHRLQQTYMRMLQPVAARILRREINDVGSAARKHFKRRSKTEFLTWLDDFYLEHQEFITREMLPVILSYAELVANEAGEEVGSRVPSENLQRFIASYVAALATRQAALSASQVRQAIDSEDPEGELEKTFDKWRDQRPKNLAKDETVRSGNAVAIMVYLAAGVLSKRWMAFGKDCPYCNDLDGRSIGIELSFIPAGESFEPEGAERPLQPSRSVGHPPAHNGCDCMIVAG